MMDPKICVSAINVPRLIKTNGLVKYTFKVIVHEIQKMKDFSTNERSIFLIQVFQGQISITPHLLDYLLGYNFDKFISSIIL